MAFRINERQDEGAIKWIGEWPFAGRRHFIQSNAYDTLLRELRRYVHGEVPGRSFLIAGHRGAGKTSLVRQVVEVLNREIIDTALAAAENAQSAEADRMLDQERPLLVKLHGPSLLTRPTPAQITKEQASSPAPADPAAPGDAGAPAAQSAALADKTAAAPADSTVIALEQITIALYRALAAEFGRSFANHARDEIYQAEKAGKPRAHVAEYLELAGQFTLELDNIPRPATLRAFYRRIGRIDAGVLWPSGIGAALLREGLNDRGIREIVALSTAAQAFEVCIGEIASKRTDKHTHARESSVETKGEATLKDIADKAFGVLAGLGAGVLAHEALGTAGAVALGLATGLLSMLTLSWTSKRSAKTEHFLDYTFIRRRDKQSLERDLPLVIQRVREAGLAPVFMVDELDKLEDATTRVADLIKSLKHLTTDFGCFCFLTDRKYYDELIAKVEREAFPVEHTFFSHLLFVLPHPDRFLEFLREITLPEPAVAIADPAGTPAALGQADDIARSIFGLFVLHRAKLNMSEVLRELAEQCHADGRVRPSPTDLRRLEYVFAASIQLAIGLILKRSAMRQRVEADPRFMQWAIDALYLLSRAWESKAAKVMLDRHSIVTCLLARSGNTGIADPARAEQCLLKAGMGRIDLDIIERSVGLLAELLCNSAKLKSELSKTGQTDLAELIPAQDLIKRTDSAAGEYEFLYDMYGEEVEVRERLRAALTAANLPTELSGRIASPLDFLKQFEDKLKAQDISIADLVALQILPATLDAGELERASSRLLDAKYHDEPYDRLSKDLSLVGSVAAFMDHNGAKLAALFRLALQVAADARSEQNTPFLPLRRTIEAVARYVDIRSFFQQSEVSTSPLEQILGRRNDPSGPALAGNVAAVGAWGASLNVLREELADQLPRLNAGFVEAGWREWLRRVYRHLTDTDSVVQPARYSDIVSCAANWPPGRLFRRDLGQMSLAEWSDLCLSGFPGVSTEGIPPWTFAAGLCVLGFGRELVEQAAELTPPSEYQRVKELASRAPPANEPGFVMIMRDDGPSMATAPHQPLHVPLLALPGDRLTLYDPALKWLRSQGALTATIDEEVVP